MLIWINGPFGAGKTQTAHELLRRMPGSFIYDPENIGYFLQRNLPRTMARDDFQDYRLWRQLNHAILKQMDEAGIGPIIVPMTIVEPAIFLELIGKLREEGVTVHHYALIASRTTLLRRLRSRGDGAGSWPAKQINRCLDGLTSSSLFEQQIDTEGKTIGEVAEEIAGSLDIALLPDNRNGWHKSWDRLKIKLKHIHWFN